jgi:hypothetical protein
LLFLHALHFLKHKIRNQILIQPLKKDILAQVLLFRPALTKALSMPRPRLLRLVHRRRALVNQLAVLALQHTLKLGVNLLGLGSVLLV